MEDKSDRNLGRALEISREMLILSEQGEKDASDDTCRILYGIMRDCAYKIKAQAESETKKHLLKTIEDKFAHPNSQL